VALTVFAGLLVGLVVLVVVAAPSGSVATNEEGTHELQLAMLTVPVADADPVVEIPDQFLGVPHGQPQFDTTDLGPDLTLRQDTADLEPLDPDEVLRSVYLGHDREGEPYHIWHSGSPDFRQMLGQIIADFGSFGRLETSYGTEATGEGIFERGQEESIAAMGLTTGSLSQTTDRPTILTAEWHGLPGEVSAVVFYQDGVPIGWQIPVSGTVALQESYHEDIETFSLSVEMVALTVEGEEWRRYVLIR
jgi:hypothetical protein